MSSPWTRPRDRLIAALLAVLVIAAGLLVWFTSDSRNTHTATAGPPGRTLDGPETPPEQLREIWRAASADTPEPVADGVSVVTGNGGTVTGRDALTGRQRWFYRRDLDLCTVSLAWSNVLAAYRKSSGCSEVSKLDINTGRRLAQRNGDAELGTRLINDGSHVVTTGARLLNVWSQDLIRSMEYGKIPAPVEPGRQPRRGCTYSSAAVASGKIAVVEQGCPGDQADRLTVIGTTHDDDGESKSDKPHQLLSKELPGVGARVIAVANDENPLVAVVLGHTKQLLIYGPKGKLRKQYALDLPEADLVGKLPGRTAAVTRTGSTLFWYTGSATIALDDATLAPRWTLPRTLGPGAMFGGRLLMPIEGGLAVLDQRTGKPERTIAVDRGDYRGPVRISSVGPVLLEQRGTALVALR